MMNVPSFTILENRVYNEHGEAIWDFFFFYKNIRTFVVITYAYSQHSNCSVVDNIYFCDHTYETRRLGRRFSYTGVLPCSRTHKRTKYDQHNERFIGDKIFCGGEKIRYQDKKKVTDFIHIVTVFTRDI